MPGPRQEQLWTQRVEPVRTSDQREKIMPNANEAKLLRVYARNSGGVVAQDTIPTDTAFEIVSEAEVGLALFNNGGPYNLILTVEDLATSTVVHRANKAGWLHEAEAAAGVSPNWSAPAFQFPFQVPAQPVMDHPYKARVVMTIGAADKIVEHRASEVFVIVS
jgi:hypothetical protein